MLVLYMSLLLHHNKSGVFFTPVFIRMCLFIKGLHEIRYILLQMPNQDSEAEVSAEAEVDCIRGITLIL